MNLRQCIAALVLAAAPVTTAHAQSFDFPRPSPNARVSQMVGVTEVSVEYSSPAVKGRKIFGGLLPEGKLWRTGANAATKITFSKDVSVAGKPVPAGSYSIFSLPGAAEFTVILNKNATAAEREYKQDLDVVRFTAKPATIAKRERLAFVFADTTDRSTSLDLEWDTVRVSIPITVDTDAQMAAQLKALEEGGWMPAQRAALYLLEDKKDYAGALAWADKSLAMKTEWWNSWVKAQALHGLGKNKEAREWATKANDLGAKAAFFGADAVKAALKEWPAK